MKLRKHTKKVPKKISKGTKKVKSNINPLTGKLKKAVQCKHMIDSKLTASGKTQCALRTLNPDQYCKKHQTASTDAHAQKRLHEKKLHILEKRDSSKIVHLPHRIGGSTNYEEFSRPIKDTKYERESRRKIGKR